MLAPLGYNLHANRSSIGREGPVARLRNARARVQASSPRCAPRPTHRRHGRVTCLCTTQAAEQTESPPTAAAGFVRSHLLRNRRGLWKIRHITADDLTDVADLQASSFHEALPVSVFDRLAFTVFRAEVLDALKKKLPVVKPDSFAMLVVEELQTSSTGSTSSSGSSIDCGDSDSDWDCTSCDWDAEAAAGLGDHQAAAAPASSPLAAAALDSSITSSSSSSSSGGRRGRIIGVVEVGLQDEADVLQHLAPGTGTYAYISSMAVAAHARRAGIGCALLRAAEQQAALWQKSLISLHVYDNNAAAIKLYEKAGLRVRATDSQVKRLLGGKVRHLMTKHIGGPGPSLGNN